MSDPEPPRPPEPPWLTPESPSDPARGAAARSARLAPPAPTVHQATRLLVRATGLGTVLRVASIVLGGLWLVTAASAFATEWHQIGVASGASALGPDASGVWRLTTSLTLSGQASWGYAVAGAIAFSASVWVAREEARDALDLLDEESDDDGS